MRPNEEERRQGRRNDAFSEDYQRRPREPRRDYYYEQERRPFKPINRPSSWNRQMYDRELPIQQNSRYGDFRRSDNGYHEDRFIDNRYGNSGYYLDDSDHHRPLGYGRNGGARPLYRTRSLPQQDFLQHDFHIPILSDVGGKFVQRPYS